MKEKRSRTIDATSLLPTRMKQQSERAFVIHDRHVSESGLKACDQMGATAMLVSKELARWSGSRYSWDYLMTQTAKAASASIGFIMSMLILQRVAKRDSESGNDASQEAMPMCCKNIDFDLLVHDRCGFTKEESADARFLSNRIGEISATKDMKGASRLVACCAIAHAYAIAIQRHDATHPSGGNKDLSVSPTPTIQDLDRTVEEIGICRPRYIGDMTFFGWDGDPASLGEINSPPPIQTDHGEIGACTQLPVAANLLGTKEGGRECIAMISGFADAMHGQFREMNWHLSGEKFAKNPHSNNGKGVEASLFNTRDHPGSIQLGRLWSSDSPPTKHFRMEGLGMDHQFFGGVILPGDFQERADEIAKHSGIYEVGCDKADQFWITALSDLSSRMISTFGLTGALVIDQLQIGYMMMPTLAAFDVDLTKKNDTGVDEATKAVKTYGPFTLEGIYSIKLIEDLIGDDDQMDSFVAFFHHTHLPHADIKDVKQMVTKAILKLIVLADRSVENNWMDRVGECEWLRDKKGKKGEKPTTIKPGTPQCFSEAIDRMADTCKRDWKAILQKCLQHDKRSQDAFHKDKAKANIEEQLKKKQS